MSKSKRLEKEIDYLKFLIGGLVAIVAAVSGWLVNGTLVVESLLLQVSVAVFMTVIVFGIIYIHKTVKKLLDQLEETDD